MVLPETFTQMQENEAEHFVLYAAMPFSMISRLEVPDRLGQAKLFLAETFGVPIELAEQRLDQLQRRTLQGIWNDVVNGQFRENRMKKPLWSPETNRILKQLNRQLIAKGLPGYQDKGLLQ
jgi:glutamate formiminotransferase